MGLFFGDLAWKIIDRYFCKKKPRTAFAINKYIKAVKISFELDDYQDDQGF